MRWSVAAGLGVAALAVGADLAAVLERRPAGAGSAEAVASRPGDERVVTPLTPIALGHRRALEFLASGAGRGLLLDAATQASDSVVRVECRALKGSASVKSHGSGVVVSDRRVLTVRHLLLAGEAGQELRVLLPSGEEVAATVVAQGEDDDDPMGHVGDWLLIEVAPGAPRLPPALRHCPATVDAEVVTIGFGGDAGLESDGSPVENSDGPSGRPTWSVGRIVDADAMKIEPLAGSLPMSGVSGGAVVDASGRLVGIVRGLSYMTTSTDGAQATRRYSVDAAPVTGAASLLTSSAERTR